MCVCINFSILLNTNQSDFKYLSSRYLVEMSFDKSAVNKEVLKDPGKRRKARREIKEKFEERYRFILFISSRVVTSFKIV